MKTYGVFVEIFCKDPEDAVRQTIVPGSVETAYVTDMGHQTGQDIPIRVAPAPEPGALQLNSEDFE